MKNTKHTFNGTLVPRFFLLLAAALFGVGSVQAQSQADYEALLEMVGQEKYNHLQADRPEVLNELAYMNRHGYYVGNAGEKDISEYPDALELEPAYDGVPEPTEELLSGGYWNLYGYKIYPDKKDFQFYRIGDSNKLLVVLPVEMARQRMTEGTNP